MKEQNIAIDIGYGDTKVSIQRGSKTEIFKFPSAIASVKEAQCNFGDEIPDSYLFNNRKYFVGEKAQTDAVSTRGFGFLEKYSPLLVHHAFKLANIDTSLPINLATGLSIMNWEENEKFTAALKTINVNNSVTTPNITLFAQGQGILNNYAQINSIEGIVCVVDIGYNTFDFLVFEDGIPRKDLSYAEPIGVNKIITQLQTKIRREFSNSISELEAKKIFVNKHIMNFGEKIDMQDFIMEMKEEYADFLLNELRAKNIDILRNANKVIIGGGGAYSLEGTQLPSNVVFSQQPYEFGNVDGYLRGILQ